MNHMVMTEDSNYVILMSGDFGSGKSVTSLSFQRRDDRQLKRLVFDKEMRARSYRAQRFGLEQDDPQKLLYCFDYFPGPYKQWDANDWVRLHRSIKNNDWSWWTPGKPDVIVIDDLALFQITWEGLLENKPVALEFAQIAGIDHHFAMQLNKAKFQKDAGWWKLTKSILGQWLIDCKIAGIDVIINTTLHNVWQDYGKQGYAPDGKPWQRIIGQEPMCWDIFLQMADVSWILERRGEVLGALPTVTMDFFHPKNSIPGLPPRFDWQNWAQIWKWELERNVPTTEEMNKVKRPEPTFQMDAEQLATATKAGKSRLMNELRDLYPQPTMIRDALIELDLEYSLEEHDNIRETLRRHAAAKTAVQPALAA